MDNKFTKQPDKFHLSLFKKRYILIIANLFINIFNLLHYFLEHLDLVPRSHREVLRFFLDCEKMNDYHRPKDISEKKEFFLSITIFFFLTIYLFLSFFEIEKKNERNLCSYVHVVHGFKFRSWFFIFFVMSRYYYNKCNYHCWYCTEES